MKLPYKPALLPFARRPFRYIMIHDINCQFEGLVEFYKDDGKFQTGKLRTHNFVLNGFEELNFHFIIEKVNDDFQTILGRPLYALGEFEGLPSQYEYSIHIGMIGNMDNYIPTDRYYKQIAYRTIIPMMRQYRIDISRVISHHSIMPESGCPGTGFSMEKLLAHVRGLMVRK